MKTSALYRLALGEDRHPDAWQIELADNAWPQVLIAPTGSGKTAAVTLGWAAHRLRNPDATPRRLVWCLPMRTLVEQTAEAVGKWFGRLAAKVESEARIPRPEDVHVLWDSTSLRRMPVSRSSGHGVALQWRRLSVRIRGGGVDVGQHVKTRLKDRCTRKSSAIWTSPCTR